MQHRRMTEQAREGKVVIIAGQDSTVGKRPVTSKLSRAFTVMIWSLEVNEYFWQALRKIKDATISVQRPQPPRLSGAHLTPFNDMPLQLSRFVYGDFMDGFSAEAAHH